MEYTGGEQGCIVVVQHNRGRSRVHEMGCSSVCCGGSSCRLHRNAHIARRWLRGFRDLVLKHTVRLAASAWLILPEARRRRARFLDLHVAHGAGAIVALALRPQLAGFLVSERRRLMAILAERFASKECLYDGHAMQVALRSVLGTKSHTRSLSFFPPPPPTLAEHCTAPSERTFRSSLFGDACGVGL
uniref:Uncharacterized protein n=1 Tax=Anopheles culicifacies TaxID=139723 RepID=A0A182MIW4_9DIPT